MDRMEREFWRRVCERDIAWAHYCKSPCDETWTLFVEADQAELDALRQMDNATLDQETP